MAFVLVVDDDAGTREWLTEILEGAGHRVMSARDGLEARAIARRQKPDLVITDISMPNEEGIGLILAIRRSYPDLKIIVLSGKDPELLLDAKLLGADATLRKPTASQVVLKCVCDLAPVAL